MSKKPRSKFEIIAVLVIIELVINMAGMSISFTAASTDQKKQITLVGML